MTAPLHRDLFLKEISKLIRTHVRTTDFLGRYAGDEFVAILPNTQQQEITEMLVAVAFVGISREQWLEYAEDLRLIQVLAMQAIEPVAFEIGAQMQVVTARTLANQRDFAQVRPRAAVRATGDAQAKGCIEQ